MMMIKSALRFGRRQLHTIVSREIIKPSSPASYQLKTHNLSLYDQSCENMYMQMVTFYPNANIYHSPHDQLILALKSSLSQTLTKYYPFAGRHASIGAFYVDCNNEGAEFVEATVDTTLSSFLQDSQHEDLDHFFPCSQVWSKSTRTEKSEKVIPLAVQVNHFECGGVAVAASLSHKIADGYSFAQFFTDWAKLTRICSRGHKHEYPPSDPHFISFPHKNFNLKGFSADRSNDCVLRSFVFPNSKINDLKLKVKAMTAESGNPITNLTRVEVLNWLLFKCAHAAATINNSGIFKPTGVQHPINIRTTLIEPFPEKSIGNFSMIMKIPTKNESDMKPESFITQFRKQKMHFNGLKNFETVFSICSNVYSDTVDVQEHQRTIDGAYICTSLCRYPLYDLDFGWGKPVRASIAGKVGKNSFLLMDTANGDGIEVLVCLRKEDMAIFQNDPELLAFC